VALLQGAAEVGPPGVAGDGQRLETAATGLKLLLLDHVPAIIGEAHGLLQDPTGGTAVPSGNLLQDAAMERIVAAVQTRVPGGLGADHPVFTVVAVDDDRRGGAQLHGEDVAIQIMRLALAVDVCILVEGIGGVRNKVTQSVSAVCVPGVPARNRMPARRWQHTQPGRTVLPFLICTSLRILQTSINTGAWRKGCGETSDASDGDKSIKGQRK
jgi:hypothetical protein